MCTLLCQKWREIERLNILIKVVTGAVEKLAEEHVAREDSQEFSGSVPRHVSGLCCGHPVCTSDILKSHLKLKAGAGGSKPAGAKQ